MVLAFANELRSLGCGEQIKSLEGLQNFVGLQELRFWNHDFTDMTPISSLTSLRYLEITWGNQVLADLTPLSSLTALQTLYLDGLPITDISPLANLTQLEDLGLNYTQISDLSILSSLNRLRHLGLASGAFVEVPDLRGMISLEGLDYSANRPLNLELLVGRLPPNLKSLALRDNGIQQTGSLNTLKGLEVGYS
jgi:internalin A